MSGSADLPARRVVRFRLDDLPEQLADFAVAFPAARADARGRAFVDPAGGARLVVPFALPPPLPGESPRDWQARLPERRGRSCLLLLQAGAYALGYWDDGELLRHKADKRYVVRGNGKAQATHLRTRGKSRYGSRLRLQNWQRLLHDVNRRLHSLWSEFGAPEQVFVAVPVRTLAELWTAEPAPPLPRGDARVRRVPVHVHVPDHRELRRVFALLERGRLELPAV